MRQPPGNDRERTRRVAAIAGVASWRLSTQPPSSSPRSVFPWLGFLSPAMVMAMGQRGGHYGQCGESLPLDFEEKSRDLKAFLLDSGVPSCTLRGSVGAPLGWKMTLANNTPHSA